MTKLTEVAKKAIGEIHPALVATASKAGKPNVSAKGSLRVLDDEYLIFNESASPRTVANLRDNPQVAVICLDAATRKGCRVWGRGEVINSGDLFDNTVAELAKINRKIRNLVKIKVEEVETF